MKKKKGFTLIEIVAVIIVLSIIALVATPILIDIIEDSRKSAFKSSAYGLYDSARYYYMENELSDTVRFDIKNSNVTTEEEKSIIFAGEIKDGTVLINPSGKVALCINDDKYSAYKNYNDTRVTLVEGENCDIPTGYSIVYVAGEATIREYTNQELTDIVLELQSEIERLKNDTSSNEGNPAGTVISYMGNNVPDGYLSCDGSVYNISEYPKLAEQIKTEFGQYNYFGGDGETTFAVPDLRGEFLRGTGTATRNTGSGLAVGKHQEATAHMKFGLTVDPGSTPASNSQIYFPNIPDGIDARTSYTSYNVDAAFRSQSSKAIYLNGTKNAVTKLTGYYTQDIDGSTMYTSRPTNTSVLYCIKY